MKVASYLLPTNTDVLSACLWHNDLHSDNIFVDPKKPAEITHLIDWQTAHIEPLFMQVSHPSFLDFDGPKAEGFQAPSLPHGYNAMSDVQQRHAKSLLSQQALFKAYEVLSFQRNIGVYHALRHQKTLGCQIIMFAGNILQDGEPLAKGQLMQVEREWQSLPAVRTRASPPCPLHFTPQDVLIQRLEEAKWIQGMELMTQVLESLGTVDRGWHGWVKAEDYDHFKTKLEDVRVEFLSQLSESAEDKPQWLSAWPFTD